MGIRGLGIGGGYRGRRGGELGVEGVIEVEVGPSNRGIGSAVVEFARPRMIFGGGGRGGGGSDARGGSPEVGTDGEAGGGAGGGKREGWSGKRH